MLVNYSQWVLLWDEILLATEVVVMTNLVEWRCFFFFALFAFLNVFRLLFLRLCCASLFSMILREDADAGEVFTMGVLVG